MGFTVLPYGLATGGSVTDQDMTALADPEFSTRNSHFIFTEDYVLGAVFATATNLTRVNIQVPTWNAIGRFNVWPHNKSTNIISPPQVMWMERYGARIPQMEEFTVKATDGTSEQVDVFIWLMTMGHSKNLPPGQLVIPVRCTSTVTTVAGGWSALGALTFEQSLRGGVYSVIGAEVVGAGSQMFRVVFPRARFYKGRKLRPGWLTQQAIGDKVEASFQIDPFHFGEWGRFHTFEPPQWEVYSNAAASIAFELRLFLVYLGQDETTLLDGWVAQGWQ